MFVLSNPTHSALLLVPLTNGLMGCAVAGARLVTLSVLLLLFFNEYSFWFTSCQNKGKYLNKRLPGACNRSPGSKLLSITMQLHCGGHLGGRVGLPDTILEEDHPMTIPSKFGSNWATGSRQDCFYVNFP